MPLEKGVDVITVNALAFKRFLEISMLLEIPTVVVTDNDKDVTALEKKYKDFKNIKNIKIFYDQDINFATLEPQLFKANGLDKLNKILGTEYKSKDNLLDYMSKNKTDCALAIFNSEEEFKFPDYIEMAIT